MDGRGRGHFCPVSTHPAHPVITLELTTPRRVRLWSTPCLPSAIRFQFIFIVSKSAESLTAGATESRRRWHLSVWARDVLCLFGVPYERGFNARMACHDADCPRNRGATGRTEVGSLYRMLRQYATIWHSCQCSNVSCCVLLRPVA